MNKPELLRWLNEEQQKWEVLLAAIGESRMDTPGVNGNWTMRDIVAHLVGWNQWLVTRLQAAAAGQPQPQPLWPADLASEDAINGWIYETSRERTSRQLVEDASGIFAGLIETLQALPDDSRIELLESKFPVIWVAEQRFGVGEFFHHFYDDHAPDVLAWLGNAQP